MTDGKQLLQGIFAINKPASISSAQVVRDVQWHFDRSPLFQPLIADQLSRLPPRKRLKRQKQHVKLGHGGTLDPLATGVLILGVGSGTKTLPTFLNCQKTYETIVVFGAATDTYDRLGKVVARDETALHNQQQQKGKPPYEHVTKEKVLAALDKFNGKVWQVPPIYSAKWMNGMRLYDYARKGLPLPEEIKGKEIEVEKMELVEWLGSGTHGYGIPDKVVDAAIDTDGDADGGAGGKSKKRKGARLDGAAESESTEQMTKGVKRTRGDGGEYDRIGAAAAASTPESPPETIPHSPKRLKADAKEDDSIPNSRNVDGKTNEPSNALFPNTTNDASVSSSNISTTKTNTTSTINASSLPSTSAIIQPKPRPKSKSESLQPSDQQSHNHQAPSLPLPLPPPPPAVKLRMTVSSGFYVRSLCHDLGIAIGSYGFMAELIRTRQADFKLCSENKRKESNDDDNGNADVRQRREQESRGNVLEYADLQKGEEVWGSRVKELIQDGWSNMKINSEQRGRERNRETNERGNGRGDIKRRNTSSPE